MKTTDTTDTADTSKPARLVEVLRVRQAEIGLTDQQLSEALGYDRAIMVVLLKQGNIRLPLAKIPALAEALAVDPTDLMRMALAETLPEVLPAVERVYNPLRLSPAEARLIQHLRKLCNDTHADTIVFDGQGIVALVAPRARSATGAALA